MKKFENPNLELIKVLRTDVIATSVTYGEMDAGDPDESAVLQSEALGAAQ